MWVSTEIALAAARVHNPNLSECEIYLWAADGGLLLAHGCKLVRRQRGCVCQFKISGYDQHGRDVRGLLDHVHGRACSYCWPSQKDG